LQEIKQLEDTLLGFAKDVSPPDLHSDMMAFVLEQISSALFNTKIVNFFRYLKNSRKSNAEPNFIKKIHMKLNKTACAFLGGARDQTILILGIILQKENYHRTRPYRKFKENKAIPNWKIKY